MVGIGRRQGELGEDVGDVLFDGAVADHQGPGDGSVGSALGHEPKDLALAGRQRAQRVSSPRPGKELGNDLGVERGAAFADPRNGIEKLRHVSDAVFQQVTQAVGAVGQ